ncbi:MAG: outer membrane protein assembly factor BamD [Bacteroidota bacterium]
MTRVLLCCCCVVFALWGCSSSDELATAGAAERFAAARALFMDEDYLEAVNQFTVLTLQFQGTAYADSSQFFLAEARYRREEFLLAAFEYQQLRRNMPSSPLVADAQFMTAECYRRLAPPSPLDQQYTLKAIDEFQTFLEYHPAHPRAAEAEAAIRELTDRMAGKTYEIAQQYRALRYYRAAQFYLEDVMEKYHDTGYAPLASLERAEVLVARRKPAEARAAVGSFLERFPHSVLRSRAEKLLLEIQAEMDRHPPVPSPPGGTERP